MFLTTATNFLYFLNTLRRTDHTLTQSQNCSGCSCKKVAQSFLAFSGTFLKAVSALSVKEETPRRAGKAAFHTTRAPRSMLRQLLLWSTTPVVLLRFGAECAEGLPKPRWYKSTFLLFKINSWNQHIPVVSHSNVVVHSFSPISCFFSKTTT